LPRGNWFGDRSGKLVGTLGPPMTGLHGPSLSPDGQHVIAVAGESVSAREIWLFDATGGGSPIPLTRNEQPDDDPNWWNGGRTVVFSRRGESGWEVLAKPADGSRAEESLVRGEGAHLSRSGKYLILRQRTAKGKATVGYVTMAAEPRKFVAFPETFQTIRDYELSPDDRYLAYETEETDANQLYLVDFPGFTNRCAVSRTVAHEMKWHPDGTELFYFNPDARAFMSAKLKPDGSGTEQPAKVFVMPEPIPSWPADFDVAPDGKRFLMLQRVDEPAIGASAKPNVRVVLNWFEQFTK
jgi:Tol biopolymer transport system component